jgi:hypothetical protein
VLRGQAQIKVRSTARTDWAREGLSLINPERVALVRAAA